MTILLTIYFLGVLATLFFFERYKWRRFIYAAVWPVSLIVLGICAVFAALSSSEERFKLENM